VDSVSYTVTFQRANQNRPIISSLLQESVFKWNYNTAMVPERRFESWGFIVRVQDEQDPNNPYSTTPSKLAWAQSGPWDPQNFTVSKITNTSVVLEPDGPNEEYGTEDPRIVYRDKTGDYYLLYSAVSANPVVSRLSLAISNNPPDKTSWKRYGPLFPQESWSKSGAMLIRDGFPGPHYLFYGDSTLYPGLQIANSTDLITWNIQPGLLIQTRPDKFDSLLVEAGPMPLPLTDGNYLFLYNSARHGYPSNKPGWDIQYNVGWVILDKDDPTKVIQRSEEPLLSPTLPWEIGDSPELDLTPNVVFIEGWAIDFYKTANHYVAVYGAADSVTGLGTIDVTINP